MSKVHIHKKPAAAASKEPGSTAARAALGTVLARMQAAVKSAPRASAPQGVAVTQPALKTAEIVHCDTGEVRPCEPRLARLALQGWELQQRLNSLQEELDVIKLDLAQKIGLGNSLVVAKVCCVVVSQTERITVCDVDTLHTLLGPRFDDLVKTERVYKPQQRLLEMACDGDEPLQRPIGACLKISHSHMVSFRAQR